MAIEDKAARLIREDKVWPLQGKLYAVQGDSGTYLVGVVAESQASAPKLLSFCTCPSEELNCSHAIAARDAYESTYYQPER